MGKLFVKLGLWMQRVWCRCKVVWNRLISKLMFGAISCQNKTCTCKK